MKDDLGGEYILANDIDCSSTVDWNSGAGFEPVGNVDNPFTGTLDGRHHVISGLTIYRPDTPRVGLFGDTNQASIKNLSIQSAEVYGSDSTGLLGGYMHSTTLEHISVSGNVWGFNGVGGLVGETGPLTDIGSVPSRSHLDRC